MIITLPYPPTNNLYYRRVGSKTLLSRNGRDYREQVALECIAQGASAVPGRLSVCIVAHPPDRRRRDLDNLPKGILDALQYAGVFEDDGNIDQLIVSRGDVVPGGSVSVTVQERLPANWLAIERALRR